MYEWTEPDGQMHYSDKAPDSKTEGVKRLSVESASQLAVEPTAPQPVNPGVDARAAIAEIGASWRPASCRSRCRLSDS
jgi:hypothetical protein